ncbi:hypothetical protein QF037_000364 [Streptomyces canus]|uniref:hypothetical protein n=1 Tax=Streptomyces canus TaxID=58343 RepID=UPI00277E8CE4|nr:hypothetical protein [Streptomyces canus]MDQ0596019.1 hypothetical protein [Streptomyces canus]
MLEGVLIAESLRAGAELTGIPLRITKLTRIEMTDAGDDQPRLWTLLDFAAEEPEAQHLADQLASCLSSTGGWYTDFHTSSDTFVIFANKVFIGAPSVSWLRVGGASALERRAHPGTTEEGGRGVACLVACPLSPSGRLRCDAPSARFVP